MNAKVIEAHLAKVTDYIKENTTPIAIALGAVVYTTLLLLVFLLGRRSGLRLQKYSAFIKVNSKKVKSIGSKERIVRIFIQRVSSVIKLALTIELYVILFEGYQQYKISQLIDLEFLKRMLKNLDYSLLAVFVLVSILVMLKKGLNKIMRWQSSNRQMALRERDSYIGSLLKDIGPELS